MRSTHLATLAALVLIPCALWAQGPTPRDVVAAGAVGDGKTDCTAIFQRLLDEAGKAGGGVVYVPAGRFRLDGTLTVPANVTLQGIFRWAPTTPSVESASGSVLCAYAGRNAPKDPPFIALAGDNAALAGLIVVYPEWRKTEVPPVPYPPCVGSQDTQNVSVQDCLLLNPYDGIRLVRAHRHLVRNLTGYPSHVGIYVDECYDIGHVENVHLWPFGTTYEANDPYSKWVNTEGTAFEFARTDWEYVQNTFCFGYGVGYKFSQSAHGAANGNFLGLGADSCERAVLVEQAQPPGLLITNGEFVGRWGSENAVCMEIAPQAEGVVSLQNCSFWGPIDRCVWMRSPHSQFTASGCHFINWDNRGVGSAALQLDAGRSCVQGCSFHEDRTHVQVGPTVTSVILTANQAEGGFRVDNQAGARMIASANETDPIEWTPQARSHYRLTVGAEGDARYLSGFSGRERQDGHPYRWTSGTAFLILPVPQGKACTVTVDCDARAAAIAADSGLYLGDQRLGTLTFGKPLVAELPAADGEQVRLQLRCQGWVPQKLDAGSQDPRTLGVLVRTITVKTADAGERVFSASTGLWLDATPAQ